MQKNILISLLLLCSAGAVRAQACFTYDAAGNRTQRVDCCTACKTNPSTEDRSAAATADGLTL
jgi:hypothetical protein